MAITTVDGLLTGSKQDVEYFKTGQVNPNTQAWYDCIDLAGIPAAGSLSPGDTTSGLVPTDATAGFPTIDAFGAGNVGYLSQINYVHNVSTRIELYDRLYHAGAFAMTSLTTFTLSSVPSATGRMPDGAGKGCLIFVIAATAMANSATTVSVGYTNSAGTTGRSTGASPSFANLPARRLYAMPLQAGDAGVRAIESVTIGGATNASGTVTVVLARPLWSGSIRAEGLSIVHGFDKTGLPRIYDTSALWPIFSFDAGGNQIPPQMLMTVVNG